MDTQDQINRDQNDSSRAQAATNRAQTVNNEGQGEKNVANEFKFQMMNQRIEQIERENREKTEAMAKEIAALKAYKDSALLWGIITLGGALITTVGALIKVLLPGIGK